MPKKPSSAKTSKTRQLASPEPAQLKAVERLIESGDYPRAAERARALTRRFPNHSGGWRLLIDALRQGQTLAAAALAALHWAEQRPGSLAAQETLFELAVELDCRFLADRVAERVRALGGATPGFPLSAHMLDELTLQPDDSHASPDIMARLDLGRLYMEAREFATALHQFDGIEIVPARNNRALALFHLDRTEESLAAFLDAWQYDAENLFALGWAVKLRLYLGDDAGARGLTVPLVRTPARRGEDAIGQLSALLLLREDQAAWECFERIRHSDWVDLENGQRSVMWRHLGACAASRLGRVREARSLWAEVRRLDPKSVLAPGNPSALERDPQGGLYPEIFDIGQCFPIGWLAALRAGGADRLEAGLDACAVADGYLEAIYLTGDAAVRQVSTMLLRRRLQVPATVRGERQAADIVRDLIALPIGTPDERMGLAHALGAAGALPADGIVAIWDGSELRQVRPFSTEIYREPDPMDLPKDLQRLLEEATPLLRAGDLPAAESRLLKILARFPHYRRALANLASVRAQQGRDDECRALLRQAIEANPDYVFGRCYLANLLIEEGKLDDALPLLEGLAERPRMHIQDVFMLYGTLAMYDRANGDVEAANRKIEVLAGLVEDANEERLLEQAKRRLDRVAPPETQG